MPAKLQDLTNQQFGRLVALTYTGRRTRSGNSLWLCTGHFVEVAAHNLKRGQRSCGCWRKDRLTTHGHRGQKHPLYVKWLGMRSRCNNPNHPNYHNYGGRGISVCSEWDSFPAYLEHVSKLPYYSEEGRSMDRIDNDGNYEPGNVRWATDDQQRRNKRNRRSK